MQSLKQYNCLTKIFYNAHHKASQSAFAKYFDYGFNISQVYFPKLTYKNTYDKQYLKASVKYSPYIVVGLIALTMYATKETIKRN